mgnify:FL=1
MARKDTLIARNINFTATRREWTFPQPLAGSMKAVGVSIDVSGWNAPSSTLTVGLEASTDSETWHPYCSMSASGVPSTNPDGTPTAQTIFIVRPPPAGTYMKAFAYTNGQSIRLPISLVEIT